MVLSNSIIYLLPLKILIKEVIEKLGMDSEKLKFASRPTFYQENNGVMVMTTSPSMTTNSKHISVKYHWFSQHIGKEFVIQNIESENQKTSILTKI